MQEELSISSAGLAWGHAMQVHLPGRLARACAQLEHGTAGLLNIYSFRTSPSPCGLFFMVYPVARLFTCQTSKSRKTEPVSPSSCLGTCQSFFLLCLQSQHMASTAIRWSEQSQGQPRFTPMRMRHYLLVGSDKVTLHSDYGMGDIAVAGFGHVIYHTWHIICEGLNKQMKYYTGQPGLCIMHLKRNFNTTKI